MEKLTKLYLAFLLLSTTACYEEILIDPSVLNGAWEEAGRDFSGDTRITSTFRWGKADILRLHSFVFFINTPEMVLVAQNEAFIISKIESLTQRRIRLNCYPQGGSPDNLYTYVFKVIDDTTIQFLPKESSTPLFPARLKKGGDVFP